MKLRETQKKERSLPEDLQQKNKKYNKKTSKTTTKVNENMSTDPGGQNEEVDSTIKLKNGRLANSNSNSHNSSNNNHKHKNSEPQLERTVLTNWKKKSQMMKNSGEKNHPSGPTSHGAVRPPPEAWNRNSNSSRDIPFMTHHENLDYDSYGGHYVNGNSGVGDVKMLKIGLGVFGGIALILGTMLSFFYIQKKNKDDKLKRQRTKNHSPRGPSPHGNVPYGHGFHGTYPANYPGNYEAHGYDHQLPPGPYEGIPQAPFPPQYPYDGHNPYNPYHLDEYAQVPPQYMTPDQYYEQQNYDQNYYNMCQDYINRQRQMQMESNQMNQPVYNQAVMDYVEKIGDNLKTPKAKNRVKDGNPQGTPHPIITRRGSMKSLAQSEMSCWTEDNLSDKCDSDKCDEKSLDRSEICCDQSEGDKNDGTSQKSDSAYGSRGSIQSPNGRNAQSLPHHFSPQDLKDLPIVNSNHMFQEEEHVTSDEHDTSDTMSHSDGDMTHQNDERSAVPPVALKSTIRQKNGPEKTKLRKITTFKSCSDTEI